MMEGLIQYPLSVERLPVVWMDREGAVTSSRHIKGIPT